MARMQMDKETHGKRILDPACGSGRTLLAAADINRNNEFYGVDIDLRCARMTAINLGLRNLYGYVIWGNSLALEERLVYSTGLNINGGVIRELPPAERPEVPKVELAPQHANGKPPTDPPEASEKPKQLLLFD
jgi:hypothetical protein